MAKSEIPNGFLMILSPFCENVSKYQEFIRVYNDLFVMFPASQNSYIPNAFPRSAGIANPHHGTVKILMLFLIILVSFH